MIYQFNNILINTEQFSITSGGKKQSVEPQVFDLIVFLIQNREQIISRDQLLDQVWKGRLVSDASINNNIKSARKALGDDGTQQKVIKTIYSRGYQFVANLSTDGQLESAAEYNPISKDIRFHIRYLYGSILLLLLVFTAFKLSQTTQSKNQTPAPIPGIAVLPFINTQPSDDTDYIGLALADQIIGELNYINNITVRPTSSIRPYTSGQYATEDVGVALDVEYIISGHYFQVNNDINLNIELVHVPTNKLVWRGQSLVARINNIFTLHSLAVRQIIGGLQQELTGIESQGIHKDIPANPLAYEYYLRSIAYPYDTDGHSMAVEMLKQALLLDDQYAPAYVQLGDRARRLAQFGFVATQQLLSAETYYLKALSLNPNLLDAMAYLAMVYTESNRIEEAMLLARTMQQLNPNNATTHFTFGYIYRYAGLLDEAIFEMEQAVALDPKNINFRSLIGTYSATNQFQKALDLTNNYPNAPFVIGWQALMLMNLGQTTQALEKFQFLIDHHPQNLWANVAIIHKSYLLGNIAQGLAAVDNLVNTQISDGETIYYTAAYYGLLGDRNRCLELLKKAITAGYFNHRVMASNHYFDLVKQTPEFSDLLSLAKDRHVAFVTQFFPDRIITVETH